MTKSTAQAQIVLRFEQLRLKQTELTIAHVEQKIIWKLMDQVAEINKQLEVETELRKQLLDNFQTENSCEHK